jgi:hypothetical protein
VIAASPIARAGGSLGVFSNTSKLRAREAAAHAGPVVPMAIRPAVQVHLVRAPDDRFRCEPYAAVIFASKCVERQACARSQVARRGAGSARGAGLKTDAKHGDYSKCVGCADGAAIAKQLKS